MLAKCWQYCKNATIDDYPDIYVGTFGISKLLCPQYSNINSRLTVLQNVN